MGVVCAAGVVGREGVREECGLVRVWVGVHTGAHTSGRNTPSDLQTMAGRQ